MAQKINNNTTDALFLIGGGIVGAGLALLLAPRSGRETRREIVRLGRHLEIKRAEAINGFADTVADFSETIGEKVTGIIRSGQNRPGKTSEPS